MAAKHRSLARVAGLNVETLSKLEGHNFRTAEDVLTRSSLDLVELLDISLPAAERVVASVARNVCPKPTTARALLASRVGAHAAAGARGGPAAPPRAATDAPSEPGAASVSTSAGPAYVRGGEFLRALDSALGGGVPTGSITELVGPAGAGKTQFCLTLAVAAAAPRRLGGLDAGVVFVDTEQKFSGARVAQIAANVFPSAYGVSSDDAAHERDAKATALRALTEKILVLTPSTLSETLQRLSGLEEALVDHAVRLLVVDSVAALARAEFGVGRGQIARRQELLGPIASVLKRQAERLHMAALVTNQVTRGAADEGADSTRSPTPAPATRPPPPPPPRAGREVGALRQHAARAGGRGGIVSEGNGRWRRRRRGRRRVSRWTRGMRGKKKPGHADPRGEGCEVAAVRSARVRVPGVGRRRARARGPEG